MFKRLFFTAVGLGAGVAVGVYAVRKVEQTQRRLSPEALAAGAGARVDALAGRVRDALAEGRAVAAAREAELRASWRSPTGPGGVLAGRDDAEWGSPAPAPK
ncbi:MAG: hypothetical protein WD250_14080 [Egibacteraceae bacterium]